ncbi:RdgB/HAM1 family non-canonical purine NTP pyrophosphatase [Stenoxybacter acetivorans]|uniref:RdgB/HAM1 family non-canonical purine NTP pyrophosphatase n=1 Tax=Stenoxybacter acetivorans TaxID=422441 RepID=UPI0009FD1309|nr:RdgB/HAM1 family non-canonical purine NTP pyrophosphatase [Stenoxybacter acetivorans]
MTKPMTQLVLASNNSGKLTEFQACFAPLSIQLLPQAQFQVAECAEPYHTFIENALTKARHASRISGLPALADDSGICAAALGGLPGVYSARYAGDNPKSDAANNAKLSAELSKKTDKNVYYYCVLILTRHENDPQPLIADAVWHGVWQTEAAGRGGFGYDPHFYLPEYGKTAAELSAAEKNRVSHRGQALAALMNKLKAAETP